MRTLLLACLTAVAALSTPAAPVQAQSAPGPAFSNDRGFDRDDGKRHRHDRRRDRPDGNASVFVDFSRGYYDGLLDDRAWRPDSYNDWWHDRTTRSYPRWMQNNRNCERLWWSGGGWTC